MTVVASGYEPKKNDLYQTEPWVPRVVLDILPELKICQNWWEPAAGEHKIADVLLDVAPRVVTSDIATYSRQHTIVRNFYDFKSSANMAMNVFTNPPYGKQNREAVRFARHALSICPGYIVLVLTAKFDFGNTRLDLFKNNARFHAKIALVDRISWEDNGETGTEDHAVYVWRPKFMPAAPPLLLYAGK